MEVLFDILHVLDICLFILVAVSVGYIFVFALFSFLPNRLLAQQHNKKNRFLTIFPAYAEDRVIVDSVTSFISQDYDKNYYDVVVVSDHMTEETNNSLKQLPVHTLIATYANSSKAKALQLAITTMQKDYDYVIVLDADNKVEHDFLSTLNTYCIPSIKAIQAHRKAKNYNTSVALLDAASEEINNTLFREAHAKVGLSSALIGSGMCISYNWFKEHIYNITTSGEDKELEELLLIEGEKIGYLPHVAVYDEKVQNSEVFKNQRKRWMAAQFYALTSLARKLPQAIKWGRIDFIDKFIQQLLVPRSICIAATVIMSLVTFFIDINYAYKWFASFILLTISLLLAIPKQLYNKEMAIALLQIPQLVFKMLLNLLHLKGVSHNFIHTSHSIKKEENR